MAVPTLNPNTQGQRKVGFCECEATLVYRRVLGQLPHHTAKSENPRGSKSQSQHVQGGSYAKTQLAESSVPTSALWSSKGISEQFKEEDMLRGASDPAAWESTLLESSPTGAVPLAHSELCCIGHSGATPAGLLHRHWSSTSPWEGD